MILALVAVARNIRSVAASRGGRIRLIRKPSHSNKIVQSQISDLNTIFFDRISMVLDNIG